MSARAYVEDFPLIVDIDAIRRASGGRRRLREMTADFEVSLGDGRTVAVELRRRTWSRGGLRVVVVCPSCGRDCLALRMIDRAPGLACKEDLRRLYSAKYRSQVVTKSPAITSTTDLVEERT